jgi:hypothetical protein
VSFRNRISLNTSNTIQPMIHFHLILILFMSKGQGNKACKPQNKNGSSGYRETLDRVVLSSLPPEGKIARMIVGLRFVRNILNYMSIKHF